MYGLPQSGLLANELLKKLLNKRGYQQIKLVPGLWKHDWRPIQFTANPIINRQRNGRCSMQLQNTTKPKKRNGHAIPFAPRQRMLKKIQNILETRQRKLCKLMEKAPSSNPPQKHNKTIPNTTHHI